VSALQLQGVVSSTAALKELQETPDPPEALSCIPALQVGPPRTQHRSHSARVARHVSPSGLWSDTLLTAPCLWSILAQRLPHAECCAGPAWSRPQLSDIPASISKVPTDVKRLEGGATLLGHDLFTNDVLYMEVGSGTRLVRGRYRQYM
jgi:hypothetical protein